MSDVDKNEVDLTDGFVNKVMGAVVDTAKDFVGGVSGEIKSLVEDGSDDALRQLATQFGGSHYSGEVFSALEENGGEVAMAQISLIVQEKSSAAVCDEDDKALSGIVSRSLNILEKNGNEAAIRGVLDIMLDTKDDSVFERCEEIINQSDNLAVQNKMDAALDNKMQETKEDPSPVVSAHEL
ncbi:MAG: hypothetical protein COB36_07755 [Alphaproteobacteria bacterium]|nr:MAG: hypothetical protein COB36_07755 [Alphaproteobacteria bacterium]